MFNKKIIAFTTLLMFSLMCFAQVFAVELTNQENQNINLPYDHAAEVLSALGMLSNEFSVSKQVTRADFVKITMDTLGLKGITEAGVGSDIFSDVVPGHWAEGSIATAARLGLVGGYGDGTFRPDEPMLYQEALKVTVNMLGYNSQAEASGGFPVGYVSTAALLGLLDGAEINADEQFTGGVVAQIMYNALDVEMQQKLTYGTDSVKYSVSNGNTLLALNRIVTGTGIIEQTGQTSLYGESSIQIGEVSINGVKYNKGDVKADHYLGFWVTVYAKRDANEGPATIIYVDTVKNPNRIIDIPADDILAVDSSDSNILIEYLANDKEKKVTFKRNISCIYNNNALPAYSLTDLQPEIGGVKLLDNNSDGNYDIIFVKSYETYIVGNVSTVTNIVSDKLGKPSLELRTDAEDKYTVEIIRGGIEIEFGDLKQWDVLSVAENKSGTRGKKEVLASNAKVAGTIDGVGNRKGKRWVSVNDNEYTVLPTYQSDNVGLNPGDSGSYLLDVFGNIVYLIEEGEADWTYGLIIEKNFSDGIDNVELKVLDSDGTVAVYKTADKIQLDGVRFSQSQLKNTHTNLSGGERHIIAFRLNSREQIVEIETPYNTNEFGEPKESAKIKIAGPLLNRKYNKNVPVLFTPASAEDTLALKSSAVVFLAPSLSLSDSYEDKDYLVRSAAYFLHDEEYTTEVYNLNDFKQSGLVLAVHVDTTTFPNSTRPVMVDHVTLTQNSNGERAYKIYGWSQGNAYEAVCVSNFQEKRPGLAEDKNVLPQDLKSGDVVRLLTNFAGEVSFIERQFRYENRESYFAQVDNYEGEPMVTYGEIIAINGSVLLIATSKDSNGNFSRYRHYNMSTLPVVVHKAKENSDNTITPGTLANVYVGLKIFFRSSDGYVTDVFVYDFND